MFTDYKKSKETVLAAYDRYQAILSEFEKAVADANLEFLTDDPAAAARAKKSYDSLLADKFRIMIVGEAKCGKSTFINAFLGVEILPMDEKQCTSSIIEIKYGQTFRLVAHYAGGNEESYKGDEEIKRFLKENAAISEEYRSIPVATINHDLILRYGPENKDIPASEIDAFLRHKDVIDANVNNIPDYNEKIRKYINANKSKWRNIVVKIEILFPFKDESLRGVEIIDSPGVCAKGGLEEFTIKYIKTADSIVFLKPAAGQDLGSTHFNEFMSYKSIVHQKATFFILTRASDVTESGIKSLVTQAHKQFDGQLPADHILIVDSKAKLYANLFSKRKDMDEISCLCDELESSGRLDNFVYKFLRYRSKEECVGGLNKMSNFDIVDKTLSTFGRKRHYILMLQLLDNLIIMYSSLLGFLSDNIKELKKTAGDPKQLAKNIEVVKSDLEKIERLIYEDLREITRKYTGTEGEIEKAAKREKKAYADEAEKINKNDENAYNKFHELCESKIENYINIREEMKEQMLKEYGERLEKLASENDVQPAPFTPNISDAELESIEKMADANAQDKKEKPKKTTFSKTEMVPFFNRDKYVNTLKTNISARLDAIVADLSKNLTDYVNCLHDAYHNQLTDKMNKKRREYDVLVARMETAEAMEKTISAFIELQNEIVECRKAAETLKKGYQDYV